MKPGVSIAGLILSGGASRRMGTPKALLRLEGETFLDRLIRLFSAVCNPVIVVVGHHADQIQAGIERAFRGRLRRESRSRARHAEFSAMRTGDGPRGASMQ